LVGRRPTNLRRNVTAGALWASLEIWGRQLVQLALFAVLARLLGPEAYGLIGIAAAVTAAVDVLVGRGGWSEALIQQRDLEPAHLDAVFWFALAGTSCLALLILVAAQPVSDLFGDTRLEGILRWLSLTLPIYGLTIVPAGLLRREFDFAPHTLRAILSSLGAGAVSIPMALWGFGVWSLVGYHVAQAVVTTAVLWWSHPWRPRFRFSPAHLRQLLPFVSGIMGDRIIGVADNLLPRFIVAYALGPVALGYFTAARRLLELLFQLATIPVSRVALPSFAAVGHDPERLGSMLRFGAQLAGLVAFPCFLGAAVVAPDLMPAVFGPKWAPSVQVFQVLALIGLVTPFNQLSVVLMQGMGRVGWLVALTLASTAVLLVLLALTGRLSITAVALAMLARTYLIFPVRLHIARRITGIDIIRSYRAALPALGAALLMALAVLLWRQWLPVGTGTWLALASSVAVGVGVYAATVAILARPLLRRAMGLLLSLRQGGRGRSASGRPSPEDV
jgi:PST family polysaccharide transporter